MDPYGEEIRAVWRAQKQKLKHAPSQTGVRFDLGNRVAATNAIGPLREQDASGTVIGVRRYASFSNVCVLWDDGNREWMTAPYPQPAHC